MDSKRFDQISRAIARRLPRRGLIAALSAAGLATLNRPRLTRGQSSGDASSSPASGETRVIAVTCAPCQCNEAGEDCQCCLNGVTGGGIVRTETSDATLVLFATA